MYVHTYICIVYSDVQLRSLKQISDLPKIILQPFTIGTLTGPCNHQEPIYRVTCDCGIKFLMLNFLKLPLI